MDRVTEYLRDTERVIAELPTAAITSAIEVLLSARRQRRHVFLIGNGGSAATASHLANDLTKAASVEGRFRIRAIALTDNVPLITAWSNDSSYDDVFVEQLRGLMEPRDVVLAISASGNSPNVIRALEFGRLHGAVMIGWTGRSGGKMRSLVDHCICAPSDDVGQIENAHMVLDHVFTVALREAVMAEPVEVVSELGQGV